jgi:hypothetical protein
LVVGLVDDISPPWLFDAFWCFLHLPSSPFNHVGPTFEGIYLQPAFRTKVCPPWKSCKYIA